MFLGFLLSELNGTEIGPGGFSGTYFHKGDSGDFTAVPINLQTRLGLNQNRFEANVTWQDAVGNSGEGQAIQLTDDSGAFYFSDPENIELVIRVLDRCNLPDPHYFVFWGSSTNVEFELSITDTQTNETKTYFNPLGTTAASVQDTAAFATCP